MRGSVLSFLLIAVLVMTIVSSCGDSDTNPPAAGGDNYDRTQLLADVADHMIVPGYEKYVDELTQLESAAASFASSVDVSTLEALRSQYVASVLSWQKVSMFEIGPAERVYLRNYTNIFPTNTEEISDHISTGVYNLVLPSTMDAQGLPAIDYLLYGVGEDAVAVVDYYTNTPAAINYLADIIDRLLALTVEVEREWAMDYRDVFVSDSGSEATSSLNKLANDYLFYYERFLRAGKVGIPAGVFSGDVLPSTVEGRYSKIYSKQFFMAGLSSASEFFSGADHDSTSAGESLLSYLKYLGSDQAALGQRIVDQFASARDRAELLSENFGSQVTTDNIKMLETYDELQKNVVLLKVDMLQALNIKIDFVDADGD